MSVQKKEQVLIGITYGYTSLSYVVQNVLVTEIHDEVAHGYSESDRDTVRYITSACVPVPPGATDTRSSHPEDRQAGTRVGIHFGSSA